MGAENGVTLRDLGVFMDQPAEPVSSEDARARYGCGRIRPPGRRVLLRRPVRPVRAVVTGVLIENQPQVPFAGD